MTIEAARAECGPDVHVVGVIGSPVTHSLSPLLHNSAFDALGLADRWRSFAFEVPPGEASAALLDAMRRADVTGLSVTMPHKADVAGLVDECSDVARRLTAVNCVHQRQGRLYGTNTDGEGFLASLARGADFEPMGKRCVVIGAGGAARAVVLALASAGASDVAVVNRTPQRAFEAAALAGDEGTVVDLTEGAIGDAVAVAHLVVNATPVGMDGVAAGAGGPASGWLRPISSGPARWPLTWCTSPVRRPGSPRRPAAGATTLDGLGMLVHQAAAQLVLWTGETPPVEAMWQAAEAASSPEAEAATDAWLECLRIFRLEGGRFEQVSPYSTRRGTGSASRRSRRGRCGSAGHSSARASASIAASRSARVSGSRCEGTVRSMTRIVMVAASAANRPDHVGRLGDVARELGPLRHLVRRVPDHRAHRAPGRQPPRPAT